MKARSARPQQVPQQQQQALPFSPLVLSSSSSSSRHKLPAASRRRPYRNDSSLKKQEVISSLVLFIILAPISLFLYVQWHFMSHYTKQTATTLRCDNGHQGPCVCFPWNGGSAKSPNNNNENNNNPDEWWIHHVDWDVAMENDAGYCFQPIQDKDRAAYLRKVYRLQWHGNCSEDLQAYQINNGFGASVATQAEILTKAVQRGKPYQMTKHWHGMHWLYVPTDNTSWAWCESTDLNCYILPISACHPVYGRHDRFPSREQILNQTHYLWITWYLSRLKHLVRYKVYTTLKQQFPPLTYPCTTMHVRRSDAGLAQRPFRRYAALSEYIEAGNIQPGETVVLLTDDHSTIAEAQKYHPNINWKYVNRPRNNATSGGMNGHIPSNDPAFDTLMILAELKYGSRCSKLVHGNSVFVRQIVQAMQHAGQEYTKYYVDTGVSMEEARKHKGAQRGNFLLEKIEQSYEQKKQQ